MATSGSMNSTQAESRPPSQGALRFEVEAASWRDLGGLRALERVCFPQDAWPLWDLIGVLTLPETVRLKVMVGGQMVGFIACDDRANREPAWIATIGVLPEFRRRGIARELMLVCEGLVRNPVIRLCVRVSNGGAQELYRRLGYRVLEIWHGYYRDGEDALVMEKVRRPGGNGL
jgi:ribosomal protein S18 acetylase RimI-like enzyme